MDFPIEQYKLWRRLKLLAQYIGLQKYEVMISQINQSNVKKFQNILKPQQVDRLINGFKSIHQIKFIQAEDLESFELDRLLKKYKLTGGKNLSILKKLMMEEKLNITIQDVDKETSFDADCLEEIEDIIKSQQYKVWCQNHISSKPTKTQILDKNQIHSIPINNSAPISDMIEQQHENDYKDIFLDDKTKKKMKKQENEILKKQKQFLTLSNLYDPELLQIKLLQDRILFLKNQNQSNFQYRFHYIYETIRNDERLKSLVQIQGPIDKFKAQKYPSVEENIEDYFDLKKISSFLQPIKASHIEQHAKSNSAWKISNGVIIIGDTGAGKSTFIQKALGYQFQSVKRNELTKLQLNGKLKKEHQTLQASDSNYSVTRKMNKYEIKHGNKTFYLVDSPGFSDTGGPIIEIINQIHLENVYKHIENICYIYLLQISRYTFPSDALPNLCKQIAQRFFYTTQNQLKGLLLIVFNDKYKISSDTITNTINLCQSLYKQQSKQLNRYHLSANGLIALRYIIDSMKEGVFDPINSQYINKIKDKMSKLSFNKQNKIKINLNKKTLSLIQKNNIILKHNIEFFLERRNIKSMMYFYHQIIVLHNLIPIYIQKIKNSIDEKIKKSFSVLQEKFTSDYAEKIRNFSIKQQQFVDMFNYYQQLQQLIKYVSKSNSSMISGQYIDEKLTQINIYLKDSVNHKQEMFIKNIVYIVQKLVNSQLKEYFHNLLVQIEKKLIKTMQELYESIKRQYDNQLEKEYDQKNKFFFIYKQFYEQFSHHNAKIFNKKQKISSIQSKIAQNITQYNAFVTQVTNQGLNMIKSIQKNQKIPIKCLEKLNTHHHKLKKFYQSKYIPIKDQVDNFESAFKFKISQHANLLEKKIEKFLQLSQDSLDGIAGIQSIKYNIYLCEKQLHIMFLKQIFKNLKQEVQRKVKEKIQKLKIGLIQSLQKNQITHNNQEIYDINRRIAGLNIFQPSLNDIKLLFQQLKDHFSCLIAQLKDQISRFELNEKRIKINDQSQCKLKQIFTKLDKLTKEYQNIDQDFMNNIKIVEQLLINKIKDHLSSLKQSMVIKELKNEVSAKKFNTEYSFRLQLYIHNYLQPCKNHRFYDKTKEENIAIYKATFQTMIKVQQLIKICGEVASKQNQNNRVMIQQQNSHNQQIINALSEKFTYIKILKSFYNTLNNMQNSKINDFLKVGINNQQCLQILQMLKQIQDIYNNRLKQLNFQYGDGQVQNLNIISMGTLVNIRNECKQFHSLQMLIKDKQMSIKDKQDNIKQVNISKHKLFSQLQDIIIKITNKKQGKQLDELEKCIDIDKMKIPYLQNCRYLYEQLKNNSLSPNISSRALKINHFVDRLTIFLSRKMDSLNDQIFKVTKFISTQINNLLRELVRQSVSFHRYMTQEDVSKYKIYCLEQYDQQISDIFKKAEDQLNDQKNQIQMIILQRDFKKAKMQIEVLIKLQSQARLFEKRKIQSVIPIKNEQMQDQNMSNQSLSTKLTKIIRQLNEKSHHKAMNEYNILQHPFQGDNKYQLAIVYEKQIDVRKKNQLKAKIHHEITQLLSQFSQKEIISKQFLSKVQQSISYIPLQMKNQYGYFSRLSEIKKMKFQKNIEEIRKIKQSNTTNEQKINQLLEKYISFGIEGQHQLRNKSKQFIFQYFEEKMNDINKYNKAAQIMELAENSFWCIKLQIKNNEDKIRDILQKYKSYNRYIHQILKKIYDDIKKQIKNYLEQSKFIIKPDFEQQVDQIFKIYQALKIKKLVDKIPFSQEFKQLTQEILRFIISLKSKFQQYCPIGRYFEAINTQNLDDINFLNKNLNNLIQKTFVYQIILKKFQNVAVVEEQSSMEAQINQNETIPGKIQTFLTAINQQITKYHVFFNEFDFEKHQIIKSSRLNQENIRILLVQLDNKLKLLQIHSSITRKDYFGIQQVDINQKIVNVQNNLKFAIKHFKSNFVKSIQKLQVQVPLESSALQMILIEINNGYGQRLFRRTKAVVGQSSMVDQDQISNPLLYFDKFIMDQIVKHNRLLKESQQTLINFRKTTVKKNKQNIKKLNSDFELERNKLQRSSQQLINKTLQDYKGQNNIELENRVKQLEDMNKIEVNQKQQKKKNAIEAIQQKQKLEQQQFIKSYIEKILIMKKISFSVNKNQHKQVCQKTIKQQLQVFFNAKLIKFIGDALQQYGSSHYSFLIKSQSDFFRFQSVKQFDKKTKAQNIKYVTQNIQYIKMNGNQTPVFSPQDLTEIEKNHQEFEEIYKPMIKLTKKSKKNQIIDSIVSQLSSKPSRIKTIALILATWSIMNSESLNEDNEIKQGEQQMMESQGQQELIIMKPHPAQLVAIFLLTNKQKFAQQQYRSKLAQILTGQGKSLVLATLAIYFALQKYNVLIACYSAYLCSRDLQKFKQLFQKLKVKQLIKYNTINEVCQFALNCQRGNIKERIQALITPRGIISSTTNFIGNIANKALSLGKTITDKIGLTNKNKYMLLIDEVDVLFDKNHFGQSFNPIIRLRHQSCKKLILYVYHQLKINSKTQTSQLCQSKQFNQACKNFPSLTAIFKSQVHQMKLEFLSEPVPYEIHDKKLKYKDNDTLSQTINYGYQTIFANIKEYQNGERITKQSYNNALFIPIIFGQFSYAQLPKSFSFIIGLSGTIQSLPSTFKQILLNDYNFRKYDVFKIPSVYGKKHGATVNYMIQKSARYYKKLAELIKAQLQKNRPIIIGFSSYTQLSKFQGSPQFQNLNILCNYLHLKLDDKLRDRAIKSAGCKARVTLMTKQYARGTDFIVADMEVKNNGGMHLIATYLFQSNSDYCQFIGRTGRQGEKGSVDIFLQQQKIPAQFENKMAKQIKKSMNSYWQKSNQLEYDSIKQKLSTLLQKHNKTMSYLDKIEENKNQYIKYLEQLNFAQVASERKMNIVIGLDGTGSMARVFRQLIRTLNTIMNRIEQMKKVTAIIGSFKIQICVYRNYNVSTKNDEHILMNSNYQENVQNLKTFLTNLKASGGWGNQAIQILFRYINICKQADMLILIGDAPPNTKKQVRQKRKSKQWEAFMKKQDKPYHEDFYIETDVQTEEKKFSKDFIVHTLYINENQYVKTPPKQYFQEIAKNHKGKSQELDFRHKNYSQMLIQFMTTNILALMSGNQMRETIENAYIKKYL